MLGLVVMRPPKLDLSGVDMIDNSSLPGITHQSAVFRYSGLQRPYGGFLHRNSLIGGMGRLTGQGEGQCHAPVKTLRLSAQTSIVGVKLG